MITFVKHIISKKKKGVGKTENPGDYKEQTEKLKSAEEKELRHVAVRPYVGRLLIVVLPLVRLHPKGPLWENQDRHRLGTRAQLVARGSIK